MLLEVEFAACSAALQDAAWSLTCLFPVELWWSGTGLLLVVVLSPPLRSHCVVIGAAEFQEHVQHSSIADYCVEMVNGVPRHFSSKLVY